MLWLNPGVHFFLIGLARMLSWILEEHITNLRPMERFGCLYESSYLVSMMTSVATCWHALNCVVDPEPTLHSARGPHFKRRQLKLARTGNSSDIYIPPK